MSAAVELRTLRAFVAVADELHFGRAAERLGIAQPSLSHAIAQLERALDARLFDRTTRSVRLTDAGRALLGHARAVSERVEAAAEETRAVARGEIGRVAVGAVTTALDTFLPGIVRRFRGDRAGVHLTLREMSTPEQVTALRDDGLGVGFLQPLGQDLRELEVLPIVSESRMVAAPVAHRVRGLKRVPLRSLAGEPLVALDRDVHPALDEALWEACDRAGFRPRIVQTARTVRTLISLVDAGVGLALVPESAAARRRAGVAFRRVSGRLPAAEIVAAWRRGTTSPAVIQLRSVVREEVRLRAARP